MRGIAAFTDLALIGISAVHTLHGISIFTILAINIKELYPLVFWYKTHSLFLSNFTVTTGPIAQLLFDSAPPNAVFGQEFHSQPRILIINLGGNRVFGSPWVHMRVIQILPRVTIHKLTIKRCSSVLNGVCDLSNGICITRLRCGRVCWLSNLAAFTICARKAQTDCKYGRERRWHLQSLEQ